MSIPGLSRYLELAELLEHINLEAVGSTSWRSTVQEISLNTRGHTAQQITFLTTRRCQHLKVLKVHIVKVKLYTAGSGEETKPNGKPQSLDDTKVKNTSIRGKGILNKRRTSTFVYIWWWDKTPSRASHAARGSFDIRGHCGTHQRQASS